jgi:hypothetical protein
MIQSGRPLLLAGSLEKLVTPGEPSAAVEVVTGAVHLFEKESPVSMFMEDRMEFGGGIGSGRIIARAADHPRSGPSEESAKPHDWLALPVRWVSVI